MLVKQLTLTAIARYSNYSWRNSLLLATCLAQGGEFAFVVLKVAMSENVLTQAMLEADRSDCDPCPWILTPMSILADRVAGLFL